MFLSSHQVGMFCVEFGQRMFSPPQSASVSKCLPGCLSPLGWHSERDVPPTALCLTMPVTDTHLLLINDWLCMKTLLWHAGLTVTVTTAGGRGDTAVALWPSVTGSSPLITQPGKYHRRNNISAIIWFWCTYSTRPVLLAVVTAIPCHLCHCAMSFPTDA